MEIRGNLQVHCQENDGLPGLYSGSFVYEWEHSTMHEKECEVNEICFKKVYFI